MKRTSDSTNLAANNQNTKKPKLSNFSNTEMPVESGVSPNGTSKAKFISHCDNIPDSLMSHRTCEQSLKIEKETQPATSKELREEIARAQALNQQNKVFNLRCVLGLNKDASLDEIYFLASFYFNNKEFNNAKSCFERMLRRLDGSQKLEILIKLVICCEHEDNIDGAIYYLWEAKFLVHENEPKSLHICLELNRLYEQQLNFYKNHEDTTQIIKNFQRINKEILIHASDLENKTNAFDRILNLILNMEDFSLIFPKLFTFYLFLQSHHFFDFMSIILDKINNSINHRDTTVIQKIDGLVTLIKIHKNNNDENSLFNDFQRLFTLVAINNLWNKHSSEILLDCMDYFILNNHKEKFIEFCHFALKLQLDNSDKFEILKNLTFFYLENKDLQNAIETYKETILIGWNRDFIKDLLSNPRFGFTSQLARIQNMQTNIQTDFLYELACRYDFWYGPYKLTDAQWDNIFEKEINGDTLVHLLLSQYLTVSQEEYSIKDYPKVCLNNDLFFRNNSAIELWNKLPERDIDNLDQKTWDSLIEDCIKISNQLNDNDQTLSKKIKKYFKLCIRSKYILTDDKANFIISRTVAVMDMLKYYFTEFENPKLSKTEKEKIQAKLQGGISIIADGSKKCSDLAIAALTDIENHFKLSKFPEHQANIFINMFKLWAIQHKLTKNDQPEQTETYLYYALKFNSLLGLGMNDSTIEEVMRYPDHAIILPDVEALSLLCTTFSTKNLIDFTSSLSIFNIMFQNEKDNALKEKQAEYLNTYNLDNQEEAGKRREGIAEELKAIPDIFYRIKALQMYLDAGFLIPN